MFIDWTKHLKTEQEKEQFRSSILAAKPVLEQLHKLLSDKETSLSSTEIHPKTYEIANWSHLQAHMNGYRQCLRYIQKLIDLDQQVTKGIETHDRGFTKPRQG